MQDTLKVGRNANHNQKTIMGKTRVPPPTCGENVRYHHFLRVPPGGVSHRDCSKGEGVFLWHADLTLSPENRETLCATKIYLNGFTAQLPRKHDPLRRVAGGQGGQGRSFTQ